MIDEVDDVLIMRSAVEQGICIAALPETVVEEDIKRNRFVAVSNIEPMDAAVYASFHKKDPNEYVVSVIERLRRGRNSHKLTS